MTDNNAELGQTPSVQPVPPTTAQHAARTHQPAHPAQPQTDAQFAPQPIRAAAAAAAAAPAPEPMPIVRDGRLTSESVLYEIRRVIVGQDQMLERILVALLAGGHLLLEGVPGLAKTLTIKTLADVLEASFRRIQFTPDLVPADLVGTRIYRPDRRTFDTELGPGLLRTSSSPTRSTAPRPRSRARCSRSCRSARSRSAPRASPCPGRSS